MRRYYQGKFRPVNPDKYVGSGDITYRSLWELKFMKWLDLNASVLAWASEPVAIPYIGIDNKPHRYFPDFIMSVADKSGTKKTYMVEIKPHKQSVPVATSMRTKSGKLRSKNVRRRIVEESVTYETNERKWNAAERYCQDRGWTFKVLTEKDVGF